MSYAALIVLALLVSAIAFPFALRFAIKHHIVDNPNARKLQKQPVPILGSISVMAGITIPLFVGGFFRDPSTIYTYIAVLMLFIIGLTDDIKDISAIIRFMLELIVVWIMIWHPAYFDNGPMIDNLHGLFGRGHISLFTAFPLTMIAGVGIINAINMIDGVDGYSSGFGILTNSLFAFIFFHVGQPALGTLAGITAAALVPMFFHNVFGKTSKMFIGDAGSLVIGLVLAYNTFSLLSGNGCGHELANHGIGVVALTLAIMSVPIFDTLRVMFGRIFEGRSPFMADKTHLHHLFIDMGFSHVGTSMTLIATNGIIVLTWYISYLIGASVLWQFIIVCLLAILFTTGFYYFMRHQESTHSAIWQTMCRIGRKTHFEQKGIWHIMQKVVDWKMVPNNQPNN